MFCHEERCRRCYDDAITLSHPKEHFQGIHFGQEKSLNEIRIIEKRVYYLPDFESDLSEMHQFKQLK